MYAYGDMGRGLPVRKLLNVVHSGWLFSVLEIICVPVSCGAAHRDELFGLAH